MEKNNKRILKVGQFHYVSEKQKLKSITNIGKNNSFSLDSEFYLSNQFSLPRRGTVKSSGYDLYSPFEFVLKPGETIFIPLGINVEIENGRWLMCIPRSGVGFKYRIRLDNTVGNIDADYYMNENNEGEICLKITNCGTKDYEVKYNDRILQAVFVPFGITYDDEPISEIRTGGFGSTGVK